MTTTTARDEDEDQHRECKMVIHRSVRTKIDELNPDALHTN